MNSERLARWFALSVSVILLTSCRGVTSVAFVKGKNGQYVVISRDCRTENFTRLEMLPPGSLVPIWTASGPLTKAAIVDLEQLPTGWTQTGPFPKPTLPGIYALDVKYGRTGRIGRAVFDGAKLLPSTAYFDSKKEPIAGFTQNRACGNGL
jgi:hypothetical protein